MTYCTTCLKLLVGSSVKTYSLHALEAVVYQRECAISPRFRNANVGSKYLRRSRVVGRTLAFRSADVPNNGQFTFDLEVNDFCGSIAGFKAGITNSQ